MRVGVTRIFKRGLFGLSLKVPRILWKKAVAELESMRFCPSDYLPGLRIDRISVSRGQVQVVGRIGEHE